MTWTCTIYHSLLLLLFVVVFFCISIHASISYESVVFLLVYVYDEKKICLTDDLGSKIIKRNKINKKLCEGLLNNLFPNAIDVACTRIIKRFFSFWWKMIKSKWNFFYYLHKSSLHFIVVNISFHHTQCSHGFINERKFIHIFKLLNEGISFDLRNQMEISHKWQKNNPLAFFSRHLTNDVWING